MSLENEMSQIFEHLDLIQFSPRSVEALGLSVAGRSFLKQVQFPHQYPNLLLKFSPTLHPLFSSDSNLKNLYVLGLEFIDRAELLSQGLESKSDRHQFIFSYLCIDRRTEKILCIEAGNFFETFVNTDIICFARSLIAYQKADEQVEERLDDDEYLLQITAELKEQLLEIDPDIASSEENWWMSVLAGVWT